MPNMLNRRVILSFPLALAVGVGNRAKAQPCFVPDEMTGKVGHFKVAIVANMTGWSSGTGMDILEGVAAAASNISSEGGAIKYMAYDAKSGPSGVYEGVIRAINVDDAKIILGHFGGPIANDLATIYQDRIFVDLSENVYTNTRGENLISFNRVGVIKAFFSGSENLLQYPNCPKTVDGLQGYLALTLAVQAFTDAERSDTISLIDAWRSVSFEFQGRKITSRDGIISFEER